MTLRLPKKPPITARSFHPTKTSVQLRGRSGAGRGNLAGAAFSADKLAAALAVFLLAWPVAAAPPRVVTADYVAKPASDDAAVKQVTYTSAVGDRKLVWRPVRPSKADAAQRPAERVAQHTVALPPRPRQSAPGSAFNDPFGDAGGASTLLPPANLVGERMLEASKPQPLGQSLPPLSTGDQAPPPLAMPPMGDTDEAEMPTLDELAQRPQAADPDPCPSLSDMKPMSKITQDIAAQDGQFPRECGLGDQSFHGRAWMPVTFTWKASGVCHKPAYFEQVKLERYGHSTGPYTQPIVSGAHFFLSVPLLPYKMGLTPPGECLYTLGYYRPGSCAPYLLDPLPLSLRAAVAQAGVWTGMVHLIP